jgi:ABC-type molybdate transport system permease subunit
MLDFQQIANSYALWVSALIIVHVICAPFIAKAARRKNRSFGSFLFLALVLGPVITGLEVSKLPFSDEDPAAPQNQDAFSLKKFLGM